MIASARPSFLLSPSQMLREAEPVLLRTDRYIASENRLVARFAAQTVAVLLLLLAATFAYSQSPTLKGKRTLENPLGHPDPATSTLQQYLTRVKADSLQSHAASGSIWTDDGRFARMSTDVRAMRPHDLIQVVVAESLSSSTDGTVKNARASNASSSITSLFGLLKGSNALSNLVNQNSASGLNATGTSQSNSSLNTTIGGEVVDVLPNGMLVIEAARNVEFNQQTQTIVLRGLVRPEDISQSNQVVSTAIASLELEVKGKGVINDATHRQSLLVRILQHALIF